MNKKYQSRCQWPSGTLGTDGDISTDDHYSREEAEGVCTLLKKEGFGGMRRVFPIRVWVQELPPPSTGQVNFKYTNK